MMGLVKFWPFWVIVACCLAIGISLTLKARADIEPQPTQVAAIVDGRPVVRFRDGPRVCYVIGAADPAISCVVSP